MTPQETPDQSEIEKFIDPAAENYLPEQIQRELLRCAGANGRISVDYLFAIYRCGQAAERASHAAEVEKLRASLMAFRQAVEANTESAMMEGLREGFVAGNGTKRDADRWRFDMPWSSVEEQWSAFLAQRAKTQATSTSSHAAELTAKDAEIARLRTMDGRSCPNCGGGPLEPETEPGLHGVFCRECREQSTYHEAEIARLKSEHDAMEAFLRQHRAHGRQ